jgi:hypothetical protein
LNWCSFLRNESLLAIRNIVNKEKINLNDDFDDKYSILAIPGSNIINEIMIGYNNVSIDAFYHPANLRSEKCYSTVFNDATTVIDFPELVNSV